jgi:DNA (cytosine-5)-methyltransferase 1
MKIRERGSSLRTDRAIDIGMHRSETSHNVTALFGGIGGLELGLARAGHKASLFCECDPEAISVLQHRFPDLAVSLDVRKVEELAFATSPESDLLTAGFPCTDFSQAGTTKGFEGGRSSLIKDTIELIRLRPFNNLLLENVPNWRQLHKGAYMRWVVEQLESLGYRWAYRTIDARAFGLPQRRLRLFLFACKSGDPREILFHGDAAANEGVFPLTEAAHGFYWTEGNTGLGWGENCVPTLKGGSAVAIPSPPAILLKDGSVVTPDIRDCERLQGFPVDWTNLPERSELTGGGVFKQRRRWLLVGNAINVEVAHWIGERLRNRAAIEMDAGTELAVDAPFPRAAWFDGKKRRSVDLSTWPMARQTESLEEFLNYPGQPLSLRATSGFYRRILASSLRFKPGFVRAVGAHLERMERASSRGDQVQSQAA